MPPQAPNLRDVRDGYLREYSARSRKLSINIPADMTLGAKPSLKLQPGVLNGSVNS